MRHSLFFRLCLLAACILFWGSGCSKSQKPDDAAVTSAVEKSVPGFWRFTLDDVRGGGDGVSYRFDGALRAREDLFVPAASSVADLQLIELRTRASESVTVYGIVVGQAKDKRWDLALAELEPEMAAYGRPRSFFVGAVVAGSAEAKEAIAQAEKKEAEARARREAEERAAALAETKRKEAEAEAQRLAAEKRAAQIAAVAKTTGDLLALGAQFEGIVTLTMHTGEVRRATTRARVTRREGNLVTLTFSNPANDPRFLTVFEGQLVTELSEGKPVDEFYPLEATAAFANSRDDRFHGWGGAMQLRGGGSGGLEGKGEAAEPYVIRLQKTEK